MRIEGKTALITGGAHRVGKAITLALAGAGANVVINYHRSADAAEETAAEVRAMGVEALAAQADVANLDQVRWMVAKAGERFGGVDILVNGASPWERTPFPMEDVTPWHRITRILIDGPFYCANAVAPWMLQQGEGVIINIIDLSAWEPWPNFTAHSVGKTGLLALTRQLALELAPAVRANGIAPGLVLPPPGIDQADVERMAEGTLLKRWGSAMDVAEAVLFLVRADYITGEVIVVDGGRRFSC
jgi:NAD(P)-dependent dehydrogenase (short-subunit alcohol dehydrogenase family)